ncbi:phosphate metabolism protein 7 [Ophiostoma piceae UAMH 11346]|uniref:Phosphate metabolism protein 7 n=1 Tax=Ophiostoma piceae (strain UAMH 11346) TaxID=1262450 RepID=S3BSA0_OPHP1|nr:phosphate metabolism protein 7 [Ophiostoma piceae UAMH 11346]
MSDTTTSSSSLQGLYLTLGPIAVTSGIYFLIFLILRRTQPRWYAPRTYLGTLKATERTPALPNGMFNWYKSFFHLPDVYALQHQSLDAYLFLRFLRMTVIVTFVGCVITWPVLFPVNATGGGGQSQLDILSYSNVDASTFKKRYRYFAHLFVSWIYYIFIMYLIFREFIFYINLRQAFLLSPVYAQRLSSRTVLFTSVPDSIRDERRIRKIFGAAVRNVWVIRDTKELDENVKNRDKAAFRLEKSEIKLIKKANKARAKGLKEGSADEPKQNPAALEAGASGEIAARYITPKDRPTHKLGLLGLIGEKVDSIDWCRNELGRLSPLIKKQQAEYENQKANGSVFVEFATQAQAENAYQSLAHHEGLHMARFIGITPSDVVWSSLNLPWWQRVGRRYAVLAFITALIIFWAIPVAVVGLISNVNYLEKISFLTWLQKVPKIIMGFITGLLPSVALSILMSLVPVIMRLCARLSGEPSNSRIELFTQNAYFCFQVIQVFLVTTLSSAATAVVKQIVDEPSKATSLLANNLPKASNFYMSYIIVQGMQVAASVISQVVGFFIFHLMYKYITGTPRGLYEKWSNLSAISWGSTLPVYTNIAVIAITYSAIAPLVLGFACIGMSFFYFAYRYNVLYVTNSNIDTRGLIYPRALKQLMVGVYISQVCMIGLYGASVAVIQLVLQIIFLVFTVLFHISVVNSLDPLLYNMPQSLLAEEESRLAAAGAAINGSGAGVPAAPGAPAGPGAPAAQPVDVSPAALEANGSYTGAITARPQNGSLFQRFVKPWVYDNYAEMRELVPAHALKVDYAGQYTPDVERKAYLPPSASAEAPLLWIPRDPAGISRQEIAHTKQIDMTDAGCDLTEDGKIDWDRENLRPPIWQEEIIY